MSDLLDANEALATSSLAMTAADFDSIRRLIHDRAGISLHDGKRAMVFGRLSRRLRQTAHPSFAAYLRELEGDPRSPEWQSFVNSLTTNLTSFFREEHHFNALVDDLEARASTPLRIWCNAASTGEEPYSLAMTVAETLGSRAQVEVLCSDIDTDVLESAGRGVYASDARGLSPERLRRHFQRGTGANAGRIRVKPELTRLLRFFQFNLMASDWATLGAPFDIVFCRNVMIYFDHDTQLRVLQRMHGVMKPGALLYVGHSENFTHAHRWFRLRGKTVYERV